MQKHIKAKLLLTFSVLVILVSCQNQTIHIKKNNNASNRLQFGLELLKKELSTKFRVKELEISSKKIINIQ